MDKFVVLILGFVAQVSSDIGIGYQYKTPITSYDVPFGSVGGFNDRKYYHVEKQIIPTGGIVPINTFASVTSPPSILQTPIHEHTSFTGSVNIPQTNFQFSTVSPIIDDHLNNVIPTGHINNVLSTGTQGTQGISAFNLLGKQQNTVHSQTENVVLDSKSNFNSQNTQNVEVQKHLYFYSAPEEPEEVKPRIVTPPPPVKKNVKVLFIKTPTFNTAPISIPVLPQNEEKTLVYVLVKKPDETSVVIPTAAPTKPTKPEVYFIKYKTQKEEQEAIANIQQDIGESGIATYESGLKGETISKGLTSGVQDSGSHQSIDVSQKINTASQFSSNAGETANVGASFVSHGPSVPTTLGGGSSVFNIKSGESGTHIDVRGSTPTPETVFAQNQFSSGLITGYEGATFDKTQELNGPTTISSLNLPASSSGVSGEINVHQVYGPPQHRR